MKMNGAVIVPPVMVAPTCSGSGVDDPTRDGPDASALRADSAPKHWVFLPSDPGWQDRRRGSAMNGDRGHLDTARGLHAESQWARACEEYAAADRAAQIEIEDLESWAEAAQLIG